MPKTRRAWSEDDEKELCRLAAMGATCHEIAAALSRPEKSVRTAAERLGVRVSTRRSTVVEFRPLPAQVEIPPTPVAAHPDAAAPLLSDAHRHWEDRRSGECAAPVGVFGGRTHSCCKPVRTIKKGGRVIESSYCEEHHRRFFIPPTTGARDLARMVRRFRA